MRTPQTDRQALVLGLLDSGTVLAYLVWSDAAPAQALALAFKLLWAAAVLPRLRLAGPDLVFLGFLTLFLLATMASAALGGSDMQAVLRYGALLAASATTLALLPPDRLADYALGLCLVPTVMALIHLVLAGLGLASWHFGRLHYLGGNHPNLGGEIGAVAVLAAALSGRKRLFWLMLGLIGLEIALMQSRAALLTVLAIGGTVFLTQVFERSTSQRQRRAALPVLIVGLVMLACTVLLVPHQLLLGDPSRGLDSGLVGRVDRWADAWQVFTQHPLWGAGAAYYERLGTGSPHNGVLYGLAQHGIAALLFWGLIALAHLSLLIWRPYQGLLLASMAVLVVLNDRFLNLNPFPFAYYVLLLKLTAGIASLRTSAPGPFVAQQARA